jgi:hypothetical protein
MMAQHLVCLRRDQGEKDVRCLLGPDVFTGCTVLGQRVHDHREIESQSLF